MVCRAARVGATDLVSDVRVCKQVGLADTTTAIPHVVPDAKTSSSHNELRALDEQGPRISQPARHLNRYLPELC